MKKMNNKGFSLVELIIVIAIMAILIVVLAPQYLKYVEKSRNSTDLQSATEFKDACEIWAADPDAGATSSTTPFKKGDTFTITVTNTGISGTLPAAVQSALDNAGVSTTKFKCVSKTNWNQMVLDLKVNNNGSITWTYSDGSTENNFGKAMNANSN
ncbi:MAG: prepilin-type N-terminal cleavage/methylation domain-containing protein [Lachnospiraceae bacterium]|nr:prepilin-type N-terminal cleavage/methylation domain-containing protein [Lachnospiraceae bacterium]